ncbi:MAG: mannose-1-phosphate guanylyltransferase/mannose-6-phosphate isomerase [Parvibaculum sp.]
MKVFPVILSGGVGSRLWPTSRALYPKQLLPLVSERAMLQETAARVTDPAIFAAPMVISNEDHRFVIAAQMQEMGLKPLAHVLEPEGRNTAPAAAAAAEIALLEDEEAILLILPADHHIGDQSAFLSAIAAGAALAQEGRLVTFGIIPTAPETGYGYIREGGLIGEGRGREVAKFVEKPAADVARSYLDEGGYYWNAGIFMFRADTILGEMRAHCPEIPKYVREAVKLGSRDNDFFRLDASSFGRCPSDSIDYAVMEHTQAAAVIPVDMDWSDIGSWSALWDIGAKDKSGNVISGDVLTVDAENCYIRAENNLIAAVGIQDLVIVETGDVVMVASRDRVQDVKALVQKVAEAGRTEHHVHSRVYRPWGYYEGLDEGERHQVKHLMVNPGASLSLQLHHKRAEHWVVVKGEALVTVGDKVQTLKENESVYIPLETKHRLENPGCEPLSIIEVQSGSYLGEDDIVRFDDVYGRVREGS